VRQRKRCAPGKGETPRAAARLDGQVDYLWDVGSIVEREPYRLGLPVGEEVEVVRVAGGLEIEQPHLMSSLTSDGDQLET